MVAVGESLGSGSSVICFTSPLAHLYVEGMLRFMSLTYTNRACLLLSILFLCLFVFYGPFNFIAFQKLSRQLSVFSLRFFGHASALLVLSTIYLFRKLSSSPGVIIPSG